MKGTNAGWAQRHLEEYKNVCQRKEEEEGHSPTVKDSDHIAVASAKMLTPATAIHDPCNSLVCIKTNSFYPSRAPWCSLTFSAGCTVTQLNRESLVVPSMLLMATLP